MGRQVVYFGSIREFHFHEYTAGPCRCGDSHEPLHRLELRDAEGTVVLQCVRNTSLQDVVYRTTLIGARRERQAQDAALSAARARGTEREECNS